MRKKMSEETIAKLRANIAKAREAKMAKKQLQEDIARDSEVRTSGIPDCLDPQPPFVPEGHTWEPISGGGQVPAETPNKVEDPAFPEAEDVPHINTPPEVSEYNLGGHEQLTPVSGGDPSVKDSTPPAQPSIGIVGWKTGWPKVIKPETTI